MKRDFEDYELISRKDWFWIFKTKGKHDEFLVEFNIASIEFFKLARNYSGNFDLNDNLIEDICDEIYGDLLSNIL